MPGNRGNHVAAPGGLGVVPDIDFVIAFVGRRRDATTMVRFGETLDRSDTQDG